MRYVVLALGLLLIASTASARYVSVTWDAEAGATSYTLYWSQTSGEPYEYSMELPVPPDYSPSVTYDDNGRKTGDLVLYNGYVYECISDVTGTAPDGNLSTYWKLIQGRTATSYQLAIDTATIYMVVTSTIGGIEGAYSSEITIPAGAGNKRSLLQSFDLTSAETGTNPYMVVASTIGGTEDSHSSELTIPASKGNSGSLLQSFDLTSAESGTNPFTVGLVFKKAETLNPTLDIANYACDVKRAWNDGSAKHVICSGSVAMTADTPKTINVYSAGAPPTGTALTEADIVSAAPTAVIDLDTYGSVSLSSLLGSPDRTFISNHEMVEAHYSSLVGTETDLIAKFHVRLYKNGEMRVRAIVENGNVKDSSQKNVVPDISVNGATIWNNSSQSLTIEKHQIFDQYGWIGITDPDITIKHDTDYMIETKLVPHYWKYGPSEGILNGTTQPAPGQKKLSGTYTPLDRVSWYNNQSASGFQTNIGWLPWWDALYINSYGDERAYRAVIANARASGFFPYARSLSTTLAPPAFSKNPSLQLGNGDYPIVGTGGDGGIFDRAHAPSIGYMAYMITGDYYFLELLQHSVALVYVTRGKYAGTGTSRIYDDVGAGYNMPERDIGWSMRSIAQLAAIGPMNDQFNIDVRELLKNNVDHYLTEHQANANELGIFQTRNLLWRDSGRYELSHWMTEFWIWALGMAYDGEALQAADQPTLASVMDYFYRLPVGMTGGAGSDSYCYQRAMEYRMDVAPANDRDPNTWFTFGESYSGRYGANTSCPDGLNLPIAEQPIITQVGSKLTALALAVDHDKKGASNGWLRLESAQNWKKLETSGFEDIPIWGIYPREKVVAEEQGGGS